MTLSYLIDKYIEASGYGMDMWSKEENAAMSIVAEIIENYNKAEQKRLITEIMNEDAKDGLYNPKQTAMQDLREDLADSIVLINNRLDFLDNITDENLRTICKVMVDTTLKGIIKRIDDELLEMEKKQHKQTWFDSTIQFDNSAGMPNKKLFDEYYNETYGGAGEPGR